MSSAVESYHQVLEDNQKPGLQSVMLRRHMEPHWAVTENEVAHSWHLAVYLLARSV